MKDWWRGAVVYQIYPRSYRDANGDGVGDLKGITEKLDYVASLGVEAIWLSPFFKSPMKDYGYDVADYCDVDPLFGDLADFRALLDKAHRLNLKIIIDLVLSHTSDRHPWFAESRSGRDNPKADWYVWADPKPDGSPPNNWQAHFGGSSWSYEVRRGQYYLHNFLAEQPDLNLYNPDLRRTLSDVMRFWLDMGVDGFRLDAIGCFFHSPRLEDNPPNPDPAPAFSNVMFPTPHSMQIHQHDFLIEPGVVFCEEIRALLNEYDGRMAVAEVGGEDCIPRAVRYTNGPALLHTSYNFGLLSYMKPSADYITRAIAAFEIKREQAWPSWAFTNHDVTRVASRWHPDKDGFHHDPRLSKMLIALLCSLRGTIFLYEGEELGLPEAEIAYEQIQDPWGKYLYPHWQGRDGCRTPMPWQGNEKNAGFGSGEPWLPIPLSHLPLAADAQEPAPDSTLNFTRRFLQWRRTKPALITGEISFINSGDDSLLGFMRQRDGEKILCLFNLSDRQKDFPLAHDAGDPAGFDGGSLNGSGGGSRKISLPPYGVYFGGSPAD
jgi:alpha-glucosidase